MNKEIVNGASVESSIVSATGNANSLGRLVYDRLGIESLDTSALPDESLVIDERCEQRPAELVESKLTRLLGGATLPISHVLTRGLLRHR
jgi:hypothetical protein